MTEVYLASSADLGASFIQRSLSSTGFSSQVRPSFGKFYGTDFGTRLGLISDEHGAVAAWTDTRFGDQANGRQDVFASSVVGMGCPGVPWELVISFVLVATVVAWSAANSLGSQGRQQP
jgi:hypothetical protein